MRRVRPRVRTGARRHGPGVCRRRGSRRPGGRGRRKGELSGLRGGPTRGAARGVLKGRGARRIPVH
eukprot:8654552-Alexandrium_andersonii.AAC.1